jgi:NADH:ubiquinone oxidoreductase subunit H
MLSALAGFSLVLLMVFISLKLRVRLHARIKGEAVSIGGVTISIRDFFVDSMHSIARAGEERVRGLLIMGCVLGIFTMACITLAAIPYSGIIAFSSGTFSIHSARTGLGLLFIMAMLPLIRYLPRLAKLLTCEEPSPIEGDNFSELIAIEIALLLAAISLFMMADSFDLQRIIAEQGRMPWMWNVVRQPIAFLIFVIAFLFRMGKPGSCVGEQSSILPLMSHIHLLVLSTILAVLFFGGWQIPVASAAGIAENALPIVVIAWPLIGVILTALGAWKLFCIRGGKIFGKKSLREGLPPIIAGLIVFGLFIFFGDWALPIWVPSAILIILQILSITIKMLLIYSAMVYLGFKMPNKYYKAVLGHAWSIILPVAIINIFATAGAIYFINGGW